MPKSIVIAGALAQKPNQGGHAWVLLQYLLGFKRLGWKVLFLDRIDPKLCVDRDGHRTSFEHSINAQYMRRVMDRFELGDDYSLVCEGNDQIIGLSRRQLLDRVRAAECLVNVMGFITDGEILGSARRRVFLDIDPGVGQMWRALGLHDVFAGHDDFVTIGENIGRPDCSIPSCGLDWITTRQPVVLDYWKPAANGGSFFTSVASWRGAYGPIEYQGTTYGLRVHEFRKFASLPRLSNQPFQIALNIHEAEKSDLDMLRANHWSLLEPKSVVADPWAYYAYIQRSKAEFMVAKNLYVQANSGWFSDRSICYLASGKPVLAQDTGLRSLYPTGKGLLCFSNLDEAVAGVEEISGNYSVHAWAARKLAEDYFDSDKVLKALLARLNLA